jgi:hypothetical protein
MLPNLELSARFQTQESVFNLGVFCLEHHGLPNVLQSAPAREG